MEIHILQNDVIDSIGRTEACHWRIGVVWTVRSPSKCRSVAHLNELIVARLNLPHKLRVVVGSIERISCTGNRNRRRESGITEEPITVHVPLSHVRERLEWRDKVILD